MGVREEEKPLRVKAERRQVPLLNITGPEHWLSRHREPTLHSIFNGTYRQFHRERACVLYSF